jgi:hypothetical protein
LSGSPANDEDQTRRHGGFQSNKLLESRFEWHLLGEIGGVNINLITFFRYHRSSNDDGDLAIEHGSEFMCCRNALLFNMARRASGPRAIAREHILREGDWETQFGSNHLVLKAALKGFYRNALS